ncbi:Ig-like domain-containing protein [Candidatus Thiodubiliella endoseptemdiera]|uniref:Ig-like domain-containing protein n=1 Tax=Candidatus Thiodubiliella endoseptemdiera TaxID=2738886 RepID=UPI0034DFCEB4
MPGQTKYFISNTNGFFVNWYSDITGVESHGQALKASGNSGDDAVYVGQGTKVDATGLTSTGGNDSIYLTGTFNNYEQTLDGNTYTFKRTVTINDTEYQEEVSFTASNGDRVYFANGFFKIDIAGNDGLSNAGVFQKIKSTDINSSSSTPTDPLTSQPAIDKGGATKVFISDNNGEHITPGVKGSVFKISGNSGNDTVYVAKGTKVDATGLTSTGGNDVVYLTGTFNNYEQTLDGITYTFKRTVNINSTDYQEEVSFTASNGDRVYFADGFVKIDITGDDGLSEAGVFKRIISTDIDGSESTPGLGIGLRITDDKSNIVKNGEDITYTFTFDEAVTDFDINDITVTGGTKGTFTSVNGSESVYTLALTPPANSKGIISLTVAVDAATSKVNTALKSVAASNNQSFDTQAPTLIISDDKADALTLKTGDTITYTFTFSEAVTGFDKSVINISNGAIKTGTDLIASTTPADAGKVYTLTVVPSSDLDVGSNLTVSVSANTAITDSAGNAYSTTAANNEQAIDTKAPVAELSGNMAPNENLTMTFLEAVTINTAGSIVIYDKANSDTLITIDIANQVSLDSTKKIITINPGSDLIVNKNYYVKIDAGTFKDTAGNNYEGIDSNSGWGFLVSSFTTTAQWVDASGNSVSDNGINASESSTLAIQGTLTNSGGAAGVVISAITFKAASGTANDKVVDTSNLPTFASANGTEWTLANSKIPTLVSGETYTIEINLSSTGGGTSTGGNTTPVLIDTAAPIITGWAVNSPTDGQSGFKVDDVIELTMTTNEALSLSNATSSKVTIGNKEFTLDTGKGAAKAGASVDELKQLFFTYTVKVDDSINKADFEITNESAITLTGVTDVAGNIVATTGTYPVELDRNVDGVVPTIGDITLNWGDILNAVEDNSNGTVTVATTGVENNQEVSLVINQKTYTGTVTSNSATITVAATDLQALTHGQTYSYKVNIKDTAGNPAIEKIGDFKVDTVAPTIAIRSNMSALKAGETAMITFTLSEVSTDFVAADVTVTGGVLSGFALKSSETKVYTATFTPTTSSTTAGAISVASGKFTDAAGNNNADDSVSLTIDTVTPTIAIRSNMSALKAGETAMITFTLSEVSTDFVAADVTVTGGVLSGFALKSSETKVYTATFTPTTSSTTAGAISVASGKFTDAAGNNNADDSVSLTIDTVTPTIAIRSNMSALKAGETAMITFTLSEVSTDFVAADVTVTGGVLSGFALKSSETKVYTATFTPTTSSTTAGAISVASGKFTDAAGNNNADDSVSLTIDTVTPTIAIRSNMSALKAGETAMITFTLSEVSTDFVAADVTVTGGVLSGFALKSSETKVYTATFTPTTSSTTAGAISVASGKFTDAAGNNNADDSVSLTIDTVTPTIAIRSNMSALKAGETAMITFTLSEVSTDFVAADVTVTGGVLSGFALKSSETKVYTATFTPTTSSTTAGAISVASGKFTDAAGNNNADDSVSLTIDTVTPTIAIRSNMSALKAGETAMITFTLSEVSTDFVAADVTVTGGVLSGFALKSSETKVYTATFTPTTSSTTAGAISVASGKFTDAAGNNNADDSVSLTIDTVTPTIAIRSNMSALKAGETAMITFTLSEVSTDFVAADVTVTGGVLSGFALKSSETKVYTATFTPTTSSTTAGAISVASGKFTDAAGNNNADDSVSLTIDTVKPTIAIRSNMSALKAGETAMITFTLSEVSTDFVAADVTVTGGVLSGFALKSSETKVYTATFTPTTSSTTAGAISVASGKFTDAAGNNNADDSVSLTIDTVKPTIAIRSNMSALKAGETAMITFTLSEVSTDFVAADVTVTGGVLSGFALKSSETKVYTATFTPTTSSTTAGAISVASGKFTDAAGNNNADDSVSLTIDTVKPTIAIRSNMSALKAGETAMITFTLSEVSTDFVAADVTVTGGVLSGFALKSSETKVYTATFTPTTSSTTAGAISVASGKFTDAAGNNNADDSVSLTIDTVKPTIAIRSNMSALKAGETAMITFTLSEVSTDFVAADVTVTGGVLSGFALKSSETKVYTATFTPTTSSTTAGAISVASGKFTDAAGNNNADDSVSLTIDTVKPTIAIRSNMSALKAGETAMITFTLSEVSTDFVAADVTVTGGVLSGFALKSSETKVYTATFTPTTSSTTAGAISVASGKFTDAAGNNNADDSVSLTIDTVTPTIAIRSNMSALKAGETAMITFTLSEVSTDFVAADVTVTGGVLSGFALKSSETKVYTATFTPTTSSTTAGAISVASGKFTDAAGNNNADDSVSLTIDTVKPTIAIRSNMSALKAGETAMITFTLSEVSTDFVAADVTVTGGVLSGFALKSSETKVYTATFTPTTSSTTAGAISVASGKFTDAAGNNNADDSVSLTIDTVTPTIAIRSNMSALKAGETAMITFTLSEVSTDFVAADVTVTGGVLSGFALKSSETKVYTATFTPTTSSTTAGAISVASGKFTDAAGNNNADGSDADNSVSLTIDTNNAGAIAAISGTTTQGQTLAAGAITDADGTTGGSSVAATYQWMVSDAENGTYTAISGAIASTFTLTQAEVGKFIKVVASYKDAQGTSETVTSAASSTIANTNDVGAIAAISGTTTQGQTLAAGTITDADGTTGGSSVAATYQWTVSDTENGTYTAISGAIASTFTLTQAEVGKFIKVVASYTDAQGTSETVTSAASSAVTIDTVAPTIAITSYVSALKAGETAMITFTLSEVSTDFVAADVTVTGGVLSGFALKSGETKVYTATFTPTVGGSSGAISVANSKFTDAAGNNNADGSDADNSVSLTIDTVTPTIAIRSDMSALKAGETAMITFTLSEVSTDFVAADVTVTGGVLSGFALKSGETKVYTATFTPTADSTTDGSVSVASSKFTDAVGNNNADGSDTNNTITMSIDSVRPILNSIVMSDTALLAGETSTVTFTFSEALGAKQAIDAVIRSTSWNTWSTSGKAADVVIASLDNFVSSSKGTAYSNDHIVKSNALENTWIIGGSGTGLARYLVVTLQDKSDGSGVEYQSYFIYDRNTASGHANRVATLATTSNFISAGWKDGNAFYAASGLNVSTFDIADITASNGTISNLSIDNSDDKIYTATFTPTTDMRADNNVITVNTNWTDVANNAPESSKNSANYVVNTVAPTIAITSDVSVLKAGETAMITFTLSKVSTDFVASDVTVTGGVLSGFALKSGETKVYTATFTPTADSTTDGSVSVASSKFTDAAGNNNADGSDTNNTITMSIDSVHPILNSIVMSDTALLAGETSTVTFTFSEALGSKQAIDAVIRSTSWNTWSTSGKAADVIITSLDNFVNSDNGIVYSNDHIVKSNVLENTWIIGGSGTGLARYLVVTLQDKSDGSGVEYQSYFIYSLERTSGHANRVATLATTSNFISAGWGDGNAFYAASGLNVNTFDVTDITASNGTISNLSIDNSDDKIYTATFTPTTDMSADNNVITVNTNWTDVANNAPESSKNSANYVIDTITPTIESAAVSGNTVTITFDEYLNTLAVPDASAFSVDVGGSRNVTGVAISDKNVVLTIDGAAIVDGNTVNVNYTKPASGIVLEGTQGNDAVSLSNLIVGTSGVNTITGTSGNDIIIANAGADTLTGNGGVDTFDYNSTTDGNDTISDFVIGSGGDKLDLSDLLTGETSGTLANFIEVTDSNGAADGGDITLKIDADGGSSFTSPDIAITLTGAGITGAESTLASLTTDNIVIG